MTAKLKTRLCDAKISTRYASHCCGPNLLLDQQNVMAEVIGLVASITAIVGAAGAAARLSRTLYRISRAAGSTKRDIEMHAANTASFSSAIQATRELLQIHFPKHPQASGMSIVEESKVLENVEVQSDLVTSHIEEVQIQVRSIRSSYGWYTGLKWYFLKSDVQSVSLEMETLKSSLSLLLQLVKLETELQKEPSRETRHEMYVPYNALGDNW
jgi:hypothetical protein